jgi:hypothetical protein
MLAIAVIMAVVKGKNVRLIVLNGRKLKDPDASVLLLRSYHS